MLDIKLLREHPDFVRENLKRRNDPGKIALLEDTIKADSRWRELTAKVNELRSRRNKVSVEIATLKKQGKPVQKLMKEAGEIPDQLKKLESSLKKNEEVVKYGLIHLPNMLHDSVPVGKSDADNVEVRRHGEPPKFDFKPKSHLEILQNLGLIDSERGAKNTGHGFHFMKDGLVMLDIALQKFAIDFLAKKGFAVINPPYMVNGKVYEAMVGDPDDFAEASYKIQDEELYLIPTSEYSIGGMFIDEVIEAKDLPLKICGVSPCFRMEVGSHGKYSKGLFRMHQFNKVEQFVFSRPEDSWRMHEELQSNSEEIAKALGLHFRVVNVCTGDIGTKAAKKYDIEFWMADGNFRELGSNSNCTDYQARRLNVRYRDAPGKPPAGLVHTLNNTAIATSRMMVAVIEQFQQRDGTVAVTEVLQPYMNGAKSIGK
jgi:seryl-tRNA synthetase